MPTSEAWVRSWALVQVPDMIFRPASKGKLTHWAKAPRQGEVGSESLQRKSEIQTGHTHPRFAQSVSLCVIDPFRLCRSLFCNGWRQDRFPVQGLDCFARGAAADVRVVAEHAGTDVAHHSLNESQRDAPLDHLGYERLPEIMESEPGQGRRLRQAGPCRIPISLMLVWILSTFTLVRAIFDAGKVFGHQVVFWCRRTMLARPQQQAGSRLGCVGI